MPGIKRRRFEKLKTPTTTETAKISKIRAAIYARVSTEEQAQEGYSLDAQVERLKAYCVTRDWTVAGIFVDEGASARDTKRSQYLKMFQHLETWDALIVVKMDRIHRNARNFLAMMDLLSKREKEFVSATESLDTTTAMGRFVVSILAQIAQLESEQIGERALVGMVQAVKTGDVAMGTRAAYGYHWQHQDGSYGTHSRNPQDGKPSELVADPETAPLVRKIFKAAAKGASAQTISKDLLGWCDCVPRIIRRKYALKDGQIKVWEKPSVTGDCKGCQRVRYVLGNPTYLGYVTFGQVIYKGHHEPLIDRALFEAYNKRRRVKVQLPERMI